MSLVTAKDVGKIAVISCKPCSVALKVMPTSLATVGPKKPAKFLASFCIILLISADPTFHDSAICCAKLSLSASFTAVLTAVLIVRFILSANLFSDCLKSLLEPKIRVKTLS